MKRWMAIAALGLAACGTPAKQGFYTLSAAAGPEPAAGPGPSIFVGPVSVPESVDRTPMVLRTGPNQVEIDDRHRWAEPLEAAIPRVLAENLGRELGSPRVLSGRRAGATDVDQRVAVAVQRFESSLSEGASLDAAWTVTPARGEARTGRFRGREPAASADPAGIAAAHSRLLARLARDLAAALR